MPKIFNVFYCSIIIILTACLLVAWHKIALDDANRQMTIKALSLFHKDYLRSSGLDEKDYRTKLKKYNESQSRSLDEYLKYMESDK
jgi:hypothetical protein